MAFQMSYNVLLIAMNNLSVRPNNSINTHFLRWNEHTQGDLAIMPSASVQINEKLPPYASGRKAEIQ